MHVDRAAAAPSGASVLSPQLFARLFSGVCKSGVMLLGPLGSLYRPGVSFSILAFGFADGQPNGANVGVYKYLFPELGPAEWSK